MWDTIVPFFASLFLIVGALLFSNGVSTSDLNQTAKVIGGAIFLSLGLVSMWFGVKNWRKSRIASKEYRNQHLKRQSGQRAR
jgi:uncharacterized membrane protein